MSLQSLDPDSLRQLALRIPIEQLSTLCQDRKIRSHVCDNDRFRELLIRQHLAITVEEAREFVKNKEFKPFNYIVEAIEVNKNFLANPLDFLFNLGLRTEGMARTLQLLLPTFTLNGKKESTKVALFHIMSGLYKQRMYPIRDFSVDKYDIVIGSLSNQEFDQLWQEYFNTGNSEEVFEHLLRWIPEDERTGYRRAFLVRNILAPTLMRGFYGYHNCFK